MLFFSSSSAFSYFFPSPKTSERIELKCTKRLSFVPNAPKGTECIEMVKILIEKLEVAFGSSKKLIRN